MCCLYLKYPKNFHLCKCFCMARLVRHIGVSTDFTTNEL
jgi:hypothetical protein